MAGWPGSTCCDGRRQRAAPPKISLSTLVSSCVNQRMMIAGAVRRRPAWSTRRVSVLIVCGDESIDLLAHLAWRGEAGAGQGLAGEDGEPDFHLVQPGGVGWGEVKMDFFVARPGRGS